MALMNTMSCTNPVDFRLVTRSHFQKLEPDILNVVPNVVFFRTYEVPFADRSCLHLILVTSIHGRAIAGSVAYDPLKVRAFFSRENSGSNTSQLYHIGEHHELHRLQKVL